MIKNTAMVKQSHWFPRNMLQETHELAIKIGVSDSDVIRMALKEFIKRKNR
jgi:metal-responsive CopG/Arc/MetJ family transcriptional regulator